MSEAEIMINVGSRGGQSLSLASKRVKNTLRLIQIVCDGSVRKLMNLFLDWTRNGESAGSCNRSTAACDASRPMPDPVSQPILQIWGGPIHLKLSEFEAELSTSSTVKNDAEYDAFIAQIPTKRIQMRQPAPDSDDPMLKRPAIDFSSQMLVVVRSSSLYEVPEIVKILDRGDEREVVYTIPPVENLYDCCQPGATGRYAAALVARTEGEVRFSRP